VRGSIRSVAHTRLWHTYLKLRHAEEDGHVRGLLHGLGERDILLGGDAGALDEDDGHLRTGLDCGQDGRLQGVCA
jgi:hypothetical protein